MPTSKMRKKRPKDIKGLPQDHLGTVPGTNIAPFSASSLPGPGGVSVPGVAKSWTQQSDFHFHSSLQASLVAQMVKNPAAIWVNLGSIPGLGRALEEGMATHSCILAWRIPWTEEPGDYSP